MNLAASERARGGLALVFGIGMGLVALHLVHIRSAGEDLQTILVGILVPMTFAVGVVGGGYWLYRENVDGDYVLRVAGWCSFGAIVLALAAGLTILYQQAEGVQMSDKLFIVVNGASGGAVIGFVIGLYDVRQQATRAEADQLSRQLTVLNRVLRHDIRNDANVIHGNAELLTDGSATGSEPVRRIKQQAVDLVKLGEHAKEIERLLHDSDAERKALDLASIVERRSQQIQREYPEVTIERSLPERLSVLAHPLVDSAVLNVLENAVEHNDQEQPRIDIETEPVEFDGSEGVELRIADNGPGVPEGELVVLDRGYETALKHTSGLGLWLVNWIVEHSDGDIEFEENDPEGSVVCLRFERAEEPARPAAVSGSAEPEESTSPG